MTSSETHSTLGTSLTFGQASVLIGLITYTALVMPLQAHSADKKTLATSQQTNAHHTKKGSVKIEHQRSPSEESAAQRDRRLARECKGAPNAGACIGYTRK